MFRRIFPCALLTACSAALAACSGSSSEFFGGTSGAIDANLTPKSRLVALDANGDLPDLGIVSGPGTNSASGKLIANGATFAYQMGRVDGTSEFLGVAGVLPNSQVGSSPTVARATYSGDYKLAYADRTRFDKNVSGKITLNADFTQGTLVGQSGGLAVNGSIIGQTIGGTANYRGVSAPLTGRIGNERAVGAFAGNTGNAAVAGGFIAERPK